MTVIVCPVCATVEEAISWLEAQGCVSFKLWRGTDGTIRGNGVR